MGPEEDVAPLPQATAMRSAGRKATITWRAAGKGTSSTKVLIYLEQNVKEMLRKMDEDTGDFIIKALSYGKRMKGLQKLEAEKMGSQKVIYRATWKLEKG